MASEFEKGVLIGLLVGEGHFGGDGRQPQVTLRMHVRHEAIFHWLERTFPGGKLYGPYHHDNRHYFQWMARGSYLRGSPAPGAGRGPQPEFDAPSVERFEEMKQRYATRLRAPDRDPDGAGDRP